MVRTLRARRRPASQPLQVSETGAVGPAADSTCWSSSEVEINAINPFDFFIDDRARKVPFVYPDGQGRHRAIGPHAPVLLTAPSVSPTNNDDIAEQHQRR